MKKLVIIGAGDFAREVSWMVARINQVAPTWQMLGFVDDTCRDVQVDGIPVLGPIESLSAYSEDIYVTCAIGRGAVREQIWEPLCHSTHLHPATLIDPTAVIGCPTQISPGSIICAGAVLTVNVSLGKHCIVNLNSTIGHDTVLEDYCTLHPGVHLSGRVTVGRCTDMGSGSVVIPGKTLAAYCTLGAGSVITAHLSEGGTYVGVPARKMK